MPGSKTKYLAQAVLAHVLGGTTYTRPSTVYFVLSATAFDPAATGSACNELSSTGGYTRISATNNTTTWSTATAAVPSEKHNAIDIVFTTATANWPDDPMSIYVADASSAGNLLYGADFADVDSVTVGNTFKVKAGTFVFTED